MTAPEPGPGSSGNRTAAVRLHPEDQRRLPEAGPERVPDLVRPRRPAER